MTTPSRSTASRRLTSAGVEVLEPVVAAAYFSLAYVELLTGPSRSTVDSIQILLATLALTASVLASRLFPMAALVVGIGAVVAESLLADPLTIAPVATLWCGYALALRAPRRRAQWGLAVLGMGIVGYFVGTPPNGAYEVLSTTGIWFTSWAIGYSTARREDASSRARAALREQLLAQERAELAADVHDIVGHTLNVLVVQAGAARTMLADDPTTGRDMLLQLEQVGRVALTELDEALTVLSPRPPRSSWATPSTLGVARLPELVDRMATSGVEARLTLDPTLTDHGRSIPRAVDKAAYRIVQEALTNAVKYAAPCRVEVSVRESENELWVDVVDDGPGHVAPWRVGRGLAGITGRALRCGGEVRHGSHPAGGFRVEARLPLLEPV